MATGQKLRGFVGQAMSGRRKRPTVYAYSYPAGSYTWTCPASGLWRFVLWGAGAGADQATPYGGASGGFYLAERYVTKGQTVAVVAGAGVEPVSTAGTDGGPSSATFPNGEVITAGGGIGNGANTGGAVTANRNTDIVYAGTAGVTTATAGADGNGTNPGTGGTASGTTRPGSGAPGYGPYRGGNGANGSATRGGFAPGGGGTTTSVDGSAGGDGLVLIHLARVSA